MEKIEAMPRKLKREVLECVFNGGISFEDIVSLEDKPSSKHDLLAIIDCLENEFSLPDFWVVCEMDDDINDNIYIVFLKPLTDMQQMSFRYAISLLNLEDEVEPYSMSKEFGIY